MKNALVALFVCSSLLFISDAEASKGSVIVEILERFFKNSDEVVDAKKGQSHGAVQGATPTNPDDETPDYPEQNSSVESFDAWSDCVTAASQKQAKSSAEKMEQLFSQETDYDRIREQGLQIEVSLARTFCAEMVRCNSSLPADASALASDYETCLVEEMQELN